jgi:hypothetical protein
MLIAANSSLAPDKGQEIGNMGSYGHAQILGFAEDVERAVDKERVRLKGNGTDADPLLANLAVLHEQVASLNAQQESLKRQLKTTTEAYYAARLKLYVACSGALDTTMAAVEKNSSSAKNLQRLRSRIRKPRGPSGAVVLPVPMPPA